MADDADADAAVVDICVCCVHFVSGPILVQPPSQSANFF
jgi:hypothetical protein